MNIIDLERARRRRREDEAYSEALAYGRAIYEELEAAMESIPRPIVLKIMGLCRQALQGMER